MLLKEYHDLVSAIESLEFEKKRLREKIIKLGTHSTKEFICEVREQTRRSISLTEIEKKIPEVAFALGAAGLISESTSVIVRVIPKKAA